MLFVWAGNQQQAAEAGGGQGLDGDVQDHAHAPHAGRQAEGAVHHCEAEGREGHQDVGDDEEARGRRKGV